MTRNLNGSRAEIAAAIKEEKGAHGDAMRAAFALLPAPIAGEGDVQITVQTARDGGGTSINVQARLAHPPG